MRAKVASAVLLVSLLVILSSPATGFITGKDLLSWCGESGGNDVQCRFYIIGAADARAADAGVHAFSIGFCIPKEIRASQLQGVVATWLKAHPRDLHFGAASLLLAALHESFPCEVTK
jgi:hypothetical protein